MFKKALVLLSFVVSNFALAAVEINKASEADLDGLKGVGPATTQQILTERKKGEFKNWADLMTRVKGIGPARAEKLSTQGLTVGGASYKSSASASPAKAGALESKAGKDAKAGNDAKAANDTKAAKDTKAPKEVKANKDAKDPKDGKDAAKQG